MSREVKISVIMSVYNAGIFLTEAIQSILNQSFYDFEFIIINDGSNDSSEEIIKSFKDSRIICIDNGMNLGLIASLNKGVEKASGKYIARMDADDISLPDRFEKQFYFMEENPGIGVCGCDYLEFTANKEIFYKAKTNPEEILAWMLFNSSVVHPSLMIASKLLKAETIVFDPNFIHAEDYELWSRLIFKTKFSSVSQTLYKYRVHKEQVTRKFKPEQIDSANRVRKSILSSCGFEFSEEDLRLHSLLGSSQMLTTAEDLENTGKWLSSLREQNRKIKRFNFQLFDLVIGKQWADACGNTNIGLKAYFIFKKSDLSQLDAVSHLKLIAKCLIRQFN